MCSWKMSDIDPLGKYRRCWYVRPRDGTGDKIFFQNTTAVSGQYIVGQFIDNISPMLFIIDWRK